MPMIYDSVERLTVAQRPDYADARKCAALLNVAFDTLEGEAGKRFEVVDDPVVDGRTMGMLFRVAKEMESSLRGAQLAQTPQGEANYMSEVREAKRAITKRYAEMIEDYRHRQQVGSRAGDAPLHPQASRGGI